MTQEKKDAFIKHINKYGTDYNILMQSPEFEGVTNAELCDMYQQHLAEKSSFVNRIGNESRLTIINSITRRNNRYYVSAGVDKKTKNNILIDYKDYKLPFLAKDMEYHLKQQLSYLNEIYKEMIKVGSISEEFVYEPAFTFDFRKKDEDDLVEESKAVDKTEEIVKNVAMARQKSEDSPKVEKVISKNTTNKDTADTATVDEKIIDDSKLDKNKSEDIPVNNNETKTVDTHTAEKKSENTQAVEKKSEGTPLTENKSEPSKTKQPEAAKTPRKIKKIKVSNENLVNAPASDSKIEDSKMSVPESKVNVCVSPSKAEIIAELNPPIISSPANQNIKEQSKPNNIKSRLQISTSATVEQSVKKDENDLMAEYLKKSRF